MKAPVLKTGILQGIGGSNPSPSAMIFAGAARRPPAVFAPRTRVVAAGQMPYTLLACIDWRGGRVGRRQPPAKRLQGQKLCPGFESLPLRHAPLAQLDRASDYESEGREFESLRAYH